MRMHPEKMRTLMNSVLVNFLCSQKVMVFMSYAEWDLAMNVHTVPTQCTHSRRAGHGFPERVEHHHQRMKSTFLGVDSKEGQEA